MDENGNAIRGSGTKTDLDIDSAEVQMDFKNELGFWLSGSYKKYLKPRMGKNAQK